MYSPESDELKRKIARIATIVVVVLLIAFPVYMLVLKDSGKEPTAPRVDRDMLRDEIERTMPERRDTFDPPDLSENQSEIMPEDWLEDWEVREPVRREREAPPRRPAPQPSIAGDDAVAFPQISANGNISRPYRIGNTGNRALEVRRLSISGDAADAFVLKHRGPITVQPDQEASIDIEFVPTTTGEKRATLIIESNDPQKNNLRIALRGVAAEEESIENIARNLYEEGRRHFDSRRYRQAEEMFSNVLSIDPYYGPAFLMRGRSKYEQGEFIAALSDFDNVLKYRLSLPSNDRQRLECITLYYAALSLTEQAMRTDNEDERNRLLRPAMGRWEDFKGICEMNQTLVENAGLWMSRLSDLR